MADHKNDSTDKTDIEVPEELAAGPNIRLFADPELLARIDGMGKTHPDREDLMFRAMLSARGNWTRATNQWAADVGLEHLKARKLVTHRRPFWP